MSRSPFLVDYTIASQLHIPSWVVNASHFVLSIYFIVLGIRLSQRNRIYVWEQVVLCFLVAGVIALQGFAFARRTEPYSFGISRYAVHVTHLVLAAMLLCAAFVTNGTFKEVLGYMVIGLAILSFSFNSHILYLRAKAPRS